MIGYRKVILGVIFLLCSSFLIWQGIRSGTDLVGLATVIGAMAGGVLGVMWGNAQEHKSGIK